MNDALKQQADLATISAPQCQIDEKVLLHPSGLPQEVASKYRYWRIRVMYATIFGYATFYLLRLNFSVAIPTLEKTYGYSKAQLGFIITTFSIIYGAGKFINGFISDKSNARYFMTIGLIGSAVINLFMGFGESLIFFTLFWGINAWFQSMAWPPVARLLTHWYFPKEIGTKWALWNSSHQIGGAIIYVVAAELITSYGWQSAFLVPGLLAIGVSALLFNRLCDTPQTLGLPPVEVYKGLVHIKDMDEENNLSTKELLRMVFTTKTLWYVYFANMFLYIVRMGVLNWAPTFLQEMKGSSLVESAWQSAFFDLAGILGGIAAGVASDRIFAGRRGPVGFICMGALVFVLFYFWKMPAGHVALDTFAMICVGFFVYGAQVLSGVATADFASKKAVGMATGLLGTFGYIGGAVSGIGVGYIADIWGWQGGFIFFLVSAILGMLFFALTWTQRSKALDQVHNKDIHAKKV